MQTIRSILASLAHTPLKSSITLATVGLGVGVLIFALSISSAFTRLISENLERDGRVVMVANAWWDADGALQYVKPFEFDRQVIGALLHGVSGARAASPVMQTSWTDFQAAGVTYQFRSVLGVGESYLDVMSLELVLGSPITAAMMTTGERQALVSATLAELLFGSPVEALGQTIRAPMPEISIQGGDELPSSALAMLRDLLSPSFTVRGVFTDPGELQRRAYGIADMLVPATAVLPGEATDFMDGFVMSHIALLVEGSEFATIESQVRAALAQQYGDDAAVVVWEGQPTGASADLDEARSTVRTFSLVVNLLGFVLLVTGCVGILSITVVEMLGRTRQIAIARAFGASKGRILREFMARSLIMMSAASVIGVALSLFLSGPLTDLVVPIFRGVTRADLSGTVISPAGVLIGVASAFGVGGLLGILPVFSALAAPIAEGIRD